MQLGYQKGCEISNKKIEKPYGCQSAPSHAQKD